MIAVQIGSNKGYDDFYDVIKDSKLEKLILVEPFNEHNESLLTCYSHVDNKEIENIIITNNPNKNSDVIFYHEEDSEHINKFELASLNKLHSLKIRSNYDESGIKGRELTSMTINQLLNKYNLKNIDLLICSIANSCETLSVLLNTKIFGFLVFFIIFSRISS